MVFVYLVCHPELVEGSLETCEVQLRTGEIPSFGFAQDRLAARNDKESMNDYYVYIITSKSGVLYIGVTNDLNRRILEHREKLRPGFTSKYNVSRLVYFEAFREIRDAIAREKQLKGWRREKKVALIHTNNPAWRDLSEEWKGRDPSTSSG